MFGIYIMRHILYVLFINLLCLRNDEHDEWLFVKYKKDFFQGSHPPCCFPSMSDIVRNNHYLKMF